MNYTQLYNKPVIFLLIIVIAIVDIFLKGWALWLAAKNNQKAWFVCIFIFNTLGVLPLIYILTHKKDIK